jgi:hypothetical protein
MFPTADVLRNFLLLCLLGMLTLGAFYLRSRKLSWVEYLSWGLLLVLAPLVGPFLVILARPGSAK